MKRPVGVILSCVVLGIMAGLQLLTAVGAAFSGVLMKRGLPTPSGDLPTGAPAPGFVVAIVFVTAFISLLLAAWSIGTLIGLVRLRNWARYSVLVIGGCMAGFGTMMIFGTVVAATVMPKVAPTPNVPAHTMQVILAFYGFLYAIVVAIGVWWLVYFNQRKTKAYFLPQYAGDPGPYPGGYQAGYPSPYQPNPYQANPYQANPGEALGPSLPQAVPGRFSKVPVAVTVIACLSLFASFCCLIYCFLPFPVFAFGVIIQGHVATSAIYLAMALVAGLTGWGLLRLDNRARIAVFAFLVIGIVNAIILMLPWGRGQLQLYSQQLNAHMGLPATPLVNLYTGPIMIVSGILAFAIYGVVAWILQRYRYAFLKQPPPAPDPLDTPLVL